MNRGGKAMSEERSIPEKTISTGKNRWIRLIVCLTFYLVLCFVFGVQLCADSNGYIRMDSAREPVYPLFLWTLRSIFGESRYLEVVILLQNLLMGVSVFWITDEIGREFALKEREIAVMILFHFGVALLCQFVAGRASVYPNSIMTEGIAMSMWLLFLTLLFRVVLYAKTKDMVMALILAAVMMDTRKQMAVGYIALLGSVILAWIGRMTPKEYLKKTVVCLAGIIGSVVLAMAGTRLYNYALRGNFAQNTRDMNLVLTTSLYVADPEDERLIEEETVRELFSKTMDALMESESNYSFAGKGWRNLQTHYAGHFDMITIDVTANGFIDYAVERGFTPGMEAEQEADRMSTVIVKSLLADNLTTYVRIYLANMAEGLINTVAKRHALLDWYALFAYVAYLCLTIGCLCVKECRKVGILGLAMFIAVFANVGVTAALIFCQTRYMIYNMAMFYSVGFVMAAVFFKYLSGQRRQDNKGERKNRDTQMEKNL